MSPSRHSEATDGTGPGWDQPSVLVTGAAGFIGSHLCDRLLRAGHHVWGVDNFDDAYRPELKRRNLSNALADPRMHLVEGDVRDAVLLDGLFSDVAFDAVVHLAARSGVQASVEAPRLVFETNVMGSLDLLEALRRHGVEALVLGSSSSVHGEDNPVPNGGGTSSDRPISPFAVSSHTAEMIARSYHEMYGLSVHSLRLPSVYGPRQRPDLPLHRYARLIAQDRPVPVPGDAAPRHLVYVSDVVEAIAGSLQALTGEDRDEPVFASVDVPPAEPATLPELVGRLGEALGRDAEIVEEPSITSELTRADVTYSDIKVDLLDFRPEVDLEEGLRRFADWFWKQSDLEVPAGGEEAAAGTAR